MLKIIRFIIRKQRSGLDFNAIYLAVARFYVNFRDDVGNSKEIVGTGFWITYKDGAMVFITNRHNLDPTLKLGLDTKLKQFECKIELRYKENDGLNGIYTRFFSFSLRQSGIYAHSNADCAAIFDMHINFLEPIDLFHVGGLNILGIANQDF